MLGYEAVTQTLAWIREAFRKEQDMRNLIQLKGMGCGCCV